MSIYVYRSKQELMDICPTVKEGTDYQKFCKMLKTCYTLMQETGRRLQFKQYVIAIAMTIVQRFYAIKSISKNDRFIISTAALFLAGKVESEPRSLKDVATFSYRVRYKTPAMQEKLNDPEFVNELKESVLTAERALLYALGFDFNIEYPYVYMIATLQRFNLQECAVKTNDVNPITQLSWNFLNDSYRSVIYLQYPAPFVAIATLRTVLKLITKDQRKNKPPMQDGRHWWEVCFDEAWADMLKKPQPVGRGHHFLDMMPVQILDDIETQLMDMYDRTEPAAEAGANGAAAAGSGALQQNGEAGTSGAAAAAGHGHGHSHEHHHSAHRSTAHAHAAAGPASTSGSGTAPPLPQGARPTGVFGTIQAPTPRTPVPPPSSFKRPRSPPQPNGVTSSPKRQASGSAAPSMAPPATAAAVLRSDASEHGGPVRAREVGGMVQAGGSSAAAFLNGVTAAAVNGHVPSNGLRPALSVMESGELPILPPLPHGLPAANGRMPASNPELAVARPPLAQLLPEVKAELINELGEGLGPEILKAELPEHPPGLVPRHVGGAAAGSFPGSSIKQEAVPVVAAAAGVNGFAVKAEDANVMTEGQAVVAAMKVEGAAYPA